MVCKWHFNKDILKKTQKTKPAVLMQLRKQLAYGDGYITTPYQVSLSKSSVNRHKEMQGFWEGAGRMD